MNITIGRGNNRHSATVLTGRFAKGSAAAIQVEHNAEDLKQYLTVTDPGFRKRAGKRG